MAEVSFADTALMAQAVAQAQEAFAGWRDTPAPARGDILRKAADLLEARADEIGRGLASEEGKAVGESIGETRRAVAVFRYFAGQTLEPDGETYPSANGSTFLYARREPIGVVGVITPWNFPIAIPAWKIAPALAYGNAVVWKPAAIVPLTAVNLARALADAGLPPGVLNLVLGRGAQVGDVLVSHPAVAAVSFTGSNDVGRKLQQTAVQHGKKVQLELGGKNPAVVLADANLDHAAEHVAAEPFSQRARSARRRAGSSSIRPYSTTSLDDSRDLPHPGLSATRWTCRPKWAPCRARSSSRPSPGTSI